MTPSHHSHMNGSHAAKGTVAVNEPVNPRSMLFLAATLFATLLLAACGQVSPGPAPEPEPEPAGISLADASVIVPFDFGPGREATIQLVRTGGFDGEVSVEIDAAGLPAGVTLSATTLSFAADTTEAAITFTGDDTVAAADLNVPVQLAMTATAEGHTDSATLSVEVAAVVMNTDDDGEGSLRHLDTVLPDGAADDLIVVSFDPTVFSGPATIQLESNIDIHHGRHFAGPVNVDGEPLVTLRGAASGNGIIGVKDSIVGQFSNLIFENGRGNSNGGAIHNAGNLTLENSVIRQSEGLRGGGIYNQVFAELTLRETQITANTADQGGGLFNNGGAVAIFDSVVDSNTATSLGGGFYNGGVTVSGSLHRGELYLSGTQVTANRSVDGGGIGNTADGDLTVVRSAIKGNQASGGVSSPSGGGIENLGVANITFSEISGNSAAIGGGIDNYTGSEISIGNSTVASNVATTFGGGLWSNGKVTLTNSTIANNEAPRGGGLFVSANGASSATVIFSTIAGNTASNSGGGIEYYGGLNLRGTIVATNSATSGDGHDIYLSTGGAFTSLGYNLIGDTTDSGVIGANNLINVDPQLGALQDNGGDTATMALLAGSPAVDYVPPGACLDVASTPLDRDQRGEARPSRTYCDIGAFEVQ